MYSHSTPVISLVLLMIGGFNTLAGDTPAGKVVVIETAQSGAWSDAKTWQGGKLPAKGEKVLIRTGQVVNYDLNVDTVYRSIHISGVLAFVTDKDTQLNAGLIKIQPGDTTEENGFECNESKPDTKLTDVKPAPGFTAPCLCCDGKPALLVGTPEQPIPAKFTAKIRLHHIDGMDKETCPAIICCMGRMDFHGAPMNRTWAKLSKDSNGDEITLSEAVTGWRTGDRVVVTTSSGHYAHKGSEVRTIREVNGATIKLDRSLEATHSGTGEFRTEAANLSRNVIVESAKPEGIRGHTMYHKHSAGSISYAEFRHLGKKGILGRYPIHYHLCRDSMRGSSVVGASIWDSQNRFVTIHGTEYLLVRDCVGFQALGHGFFLEDGTEVYNVLDRNLSVQASEAAPLPKQMLPFDKNEGAGFWWANSHNTLTRNVAAECDGYGFRYEATPLAGPYVKGMKPKPPSFDLSLNVRKPDGERENRDVRTLPFIRFEHNESHHIGTYGLNMGQDAELVGPDRDHPFVIKGMKIWHCGRGYTVHVPHVKIDGLRIHLCGYEVYRSRFVGQDYSNVRFTGISGKHTMAGLEDYKAIGQFNRSRLPGFPQGTGAGGTSFAGPEIETAKLTTVDDLPPMTMITNIRRDGVKLLVRGICADNGTIAKVTVNGLAAKSTQGKFDEWEIELQAKGTTMKLEAKAEDERGNVEKTPHITSLNLR